MNSDRLGTPALTSLVSALACFLAGCWSTGDITAPERMAVGSEWTLRFGTSGSVTSTECTDQLDCTRDRGRIDAISFDPPDAVEIVSKTRLPASAAEITIVARKSATVTVIMEGDFGTEEVTVDLVVPASSRLVDPTAPDATVPEGLLLAPGQATHFMNEILDDDGGRLEGLMQTLEPIDDLVGATYDGAYEIVTAGERYGDSELLSHIDGSTLLRVRVTNDFTPTAIEGRLSESGIAVAFLQDGFGMPATSQRGMIYVESLTPDVCEPVSPDFDAYVRSGMTFHAAGTCTVVLSTEDGLMDEVSLEV